MQMTWYVGKRLAQMVPVLFGITIIVFFMLRLIPGDPVRIILGVRATEERVLELRQQLGLDLPIWQQYTRFIANLVRGDLGTSTTQRQPVMRLVSERVPITVFLVSYAVILSLVITIPLAVLAAQRRDRLPDQIIRGGFTFLFAMPAFWIGLLLMIGLAVRLKLFPVSGYGKDFPDRLHHLFLPALTISLSLSAILIRSLRSSMIDVLRASFVEFGRAQGLNQRLILLRYVLRNSLIATVTILGVNVGWLLSGSVVIETVFSLPGLGSTMISSILARDYPMVQGITLVFGLLVLAVNLLTDVSYALLDPRVTYD